MTSFSKGLGANAPNIKTRESLQTWDNVKPVPYKNISSEFTYFKNLTALDKQFDSTTGALNSTTNQVYNYEYNPEGYVTKQYTNGVLSRTFILEKIN